MVLSNKKLKQKLREELAKASISNTNPTINPQTETPKSMKQLLGSKIRKPLLSKREKRRESMNLEVGIERIKENKITHLEETEDGQVKLEKKKKRKSEKKEKREESLNHEVGNEIIKENKSAHLEEIEDGQVKLEKKKKRKSDKKDKREESLNLEVGNERIKENKSAHLEATEDGQVKLEKKKRRKRENKEKGEENGGGVNEVREEGGGLEKGSKESNMKKKKKKKKGKKNKRKNKGEDGEVVKHEQFEVEFGGVNQQSVDHNNSQGNNEDKKKVYVGGIPYYSTEDDIRSFFDHCGTITEVDCMTFPESGKFRGIAIISFKTEEAAKRALALDGSDMGGLYLITKPYKSTRTTKAIVTTDFCPPVLAGYNRVYAGNLSWDITEDDLRKLFSDCTISAIRFGEDKETGEFKGYAHVDFADNASLTKALKLDQMVLCGRPVRIRCAVPPKKGGSANSGPVSMTIKADAVNKGGTGNSESVPMSVQADIVDKKDETQNNGLSSSKIKRRTCYECGQKGHISSACPNKQSTEDVNASAS